MGWNVVFSLGVLTGRVTRLLRWVYGREGILWAIQAVFHVVIACTLEPLEFLWRGGRKLVHNCMNVTSSAKNPQQLQACVITKCELAI
jgi:hypothetical protein